VPTKRRLVGPRSSFPLRVAQPRAPRTDLDSVTHPAARILSGSELPPRLNDLTKPPDSLYLHGALPRGASVAIVGTRRATEPSLKFTRALAAELCALGISVYSGGAEGIDTAAHEGALEASGATVVVAPAGFDRPFPERNAGLFGRIVQEGGAYLSLVPDSKPATTPSFFHRNAVLVALAHVVVMVEADFRSGARNAVARARRLSRPVLVVPHAPWQPMGRGCLLELQNGARVCDGVRSVLRALTEVGCLVPPDTKHCTQMQLFADSVTDPEPSQPVSSSSMEEQGEEGLAPEELVLLRVRKGDCDIDQLAASTGLPVNLLQQLLLTLRLRGVLVSGPTGRLAISKPLD